VLTGTDFAETKAVSQIEFYNEFKSAGTQRVLGPFDALPVGGIL
jgi:hypothetical protein